MWWVRILEAWLTTRLLASPTFHRAVQNVHKKVRHLRHGPDLEEMGGTNIDKPTKNFMEHYLEEIKEQFRRDPSQKKR